MEFIPRQKVAAQAAPLDARQRAVRDIGVAAVAAALGLVEGAPAHAQSAMPSPAMPLPAVPLPKAA